MKAFKRRRGRTEVIVHLSALCKVLGSAESCRALPLGIHDLDAVMSPFLNLLNIPGSHFGMPSHMQKVFLYLVLIVW